MNKITASIEFSFKGEYITPSAVLDLDQLMEGRGQIPPLHQLLATLNKIDNYSYEYEMMLGEDIKFSNAEGMAVDFLQNGQFDQLGFERFWQEETFLNKFSPVIKQQLDIDDIRQHPALKSTLLAAYQLGKDTE